MSMLWMHGGHVALASAVKDCRIKSAAQYIHSRTSRGVEALMNQLVATCTPHLRRMAGRTPPSFRTGSHILPSFHMMSNPPSHTRTLQVSGRTPLEFGGSGQR